jgi:hypothetical protein
VIRVELRIGIKPSEIDVSDPGLTTAIWMRRDGKAEEAARGADREQQGLDFLGQANSRSGEDGADRHRLFSEERQAAVVKRKFNLDADKRF